MRCRDCSYESKSSSLCEKCLTRTRENVKAKRTKMKKLGLCIQCGKPSNVNTLRCYDCGGGKMKAKTNKPYDETNSSNPWLMNVKIRDPIMGPDKQRLTAEYIWSKKGNDRVKLLEWVFNYYRAKGLPLFVLTDAQLQDEFTKLKSKSGNMILTSSGVIKNSNIAGLKIAKHFTGELFLAARERKGKSCLDVFNDDELFMKVLKNRMGWNTSGEGGSGKRPYVFAIDDYEIIKGMRSSRIAGSVSHFKPMVAKYIYEKYNIKSTVDFSAGWGARAISAISCGAKYYGIDPLTSDKINDLIKYFNGDGFCVKECSEKLDYSIFPNVDLCFSSPPYFDVEIYENTPTQSSSYTKYEDWLEKYWEATVEKCYSKTKYFSFIAIDKVRGFDLLYDMSKICVKAGGKLVEKTPISVSKGHLSGKRKSGKNKKKTEFLMVYEVI